MAVSSAAFHTDLMIKKCDTTGCKPMQKRVCLCFRFGSWSLLLMQALSRQVALDSTSNGTEKLITVNGKGALTLKYGGPVLGGPRVYLIEEDGVNKNHLSVIEKEPPDPTVNIHFI